MTTNLPRIIAYLEKDLEDRRAGGETCPECHGRGTRGLERYDSDGMEWFGTCPDCNGTGKSPAITEAEEMLALAREEGKRVERLLAFLEVGRTMSSALAEISRVDGFSYRACARTALAEYNAPVEKEETNDAE